MDALDLLKLLNDMFPVAFPADPIHIQPLKIGIDKDLAERLLGKVEHSDIQATLKYYTSLETYLRNVVSGRYRRDLDGRATTRVSGLEEHVARVTFYTAQVRRNIQELNEQRAAGELLGQRRGRTVSNLVHARDALRHESKVALQTYAHKRALHIAHLAVQASTALLQAEPSHQRRRELNWTQYFLYVRSGEDSLLAGRFTNALNFFSKAASISKKLDQGALFPNYFFNASDLAAHDLYVNAIAAFSRRQYADAAGAISSWLSRFSKHDIDKGPYRDFLVFEAITKLLSLAEGGEVPANEWTNLDHKLQEIVPSRSVWAMAEELSVLRALTLGHVDPRGERNIGVGDELRAIADCWRLMVRGARISDSHKRAQSRAPFFIQTFLDVFGPVTEFSLYWRDLLDQNLRHILLLKADYEIKHRRARDAALSMGITFDFELPVEQMTSAQLIECIANLLQARSGNHVRAWQNSIQYVTAFQQALSEQNIARAIICQKEFLDKFRALPHVVLVTDDSPCVASHDRDEATGDVLVERIWEAPQKTLVIRNVRQVLNQGDFLYLPPLWNRFFREFADAHRLIAPTRIDSGYATKEVSARARDPKSRSILKSDLPRLLSTFHDNVSGVGRYDQHRFVRWICQVDERHRMGALRLLSAVRYYDPNDIRNLWQRLLHDQVRLGAQRAPTCFVGLGQAGKSGALTTYYLRQALLSMDSLPEVPENWLIKTIYELADEPSNISRVVFVDDFVGTGEQASRYILNCFDRHPWLHEAEVYCFALVGHQAGRERIEEKFGERIKGVFLGETLTDEDRAFSPSNPIWSDSEDRVRESTMRWAEEVGHALLSGSELDPDAHKLGWRNSQSLICFHYNIPNNTLPIFWAPGVVKGRKWWPLIDRY